MMHNRKRDLAAQLLKLLTFTIDCSKPVDNKTMDVASLKKFLQERIKVGDKASALGRTKLEKIGEN